MPLRFPGSVENSNLIRLDLLTWVEVEQYLQTYKGIILPIGSIEQHGPTGAIGTDSFTAEAVAIEIGKRTGVLVAPVQSFGMAEHHLGFPGTMSLQPSTLLWVLHDLLVSLASHGFERVFVVNGHGGNIATVKSSFMQVSKSLINSQMPISESFRCKLANWFMAPEVFQEARKLYGDMEGQHATPSEIALTLHLEPTLIRKQHSLPSPPNAGPIYGQKDFRSRYPDGRMGSDPYLASPKHGKMFLEKAAKALSKDLISFLEES